MKSSREIKEIAMKRLEEATILCDNGLYDGAFYLAGYSIELMLKAKICERFDVDNLFDESCSEINNISKVRNAVKLHDIDLLLVFSGLRKKLDVDKTKPENNEVLSKTMAKLVNAQKGWSEQSRYKTIGSQNSNEVEELISLLLDEKGLIQWLQNN
jgi:hypothetical protein